MKTRCGMFVPLLQQAHVVVPFFRYRINAPYMSHGPHQYDSFLAAYWSPDSRRLLIYASCKGEGSAYDSDCVRLPQGPHSRANPCAWKILGTRLSAGLQAFPEVGARFARRVFAGPDARFVLLPPLVPLQCV